MLLPVFRVRGGAHGLECVVVFAFGVQDPGARDLPLDIDLFSPVGNTGSNVG